MDIPASTFVIADHFLSFPYIKLVAAACGAISNIKYLHFAYISYGSEYKQRFFTVCINRLVFRMVTLGCVCRTYWIIIDKSAPLTSILSHASSDALF
jgi:hypothetical protein